MKSNLRTVTVAAALAVLMTLSGAGLGMADKTADVKALVEEGVIMAVVEGLDAALKAIGDPQGPFIKGDLYLFAGPLDRVTLSAHPYRPDLVGEDLSALRDDHGKFLVFQFLKIALENGAGWNEYWWPKPGAEEPSLKKSYVMKVPGKSMWIAGGFYLE
jgi:hypothetical protein